MNRQRKYRSIATRRNPPAWSACRPEPRVPLRRGGYLYLAVLFTTLIVVSVVTATLSLSTSHTRSEIDRVNRMSALRMAESELHRVASQMESSAAWRTQATNDAFTNWTNYANSTYHSDSAQVRYRLSDADSDLADGPTDNVFLTAHAQVGRSNVAVQVELEPRLDPLEVLNYGVTSTDDIQIEGGANLAVEAPVQVVDDCKTTTSGSLTTPQLECSNNIQFPVRGDIDNANVVLPSHNVITVYQDIATDIPISALPVDGSYRVIRDQVITSSNNPFGANDAGGIYKINAQGSPIRISYSRLAATLVITNCPYVDITNGIHWNYPNQPDAILVTSAIINMVSIDPSLSESSRSVNFNPTGSPYRGNSDADTADEYGSLLRGIIYSTNNVDIYSVTADNRVMITGSLICRDLGIHTNVSIMQLNELIESPPLAFADWVPMQFVHGSFRRVPLP